MVLALISSMDITLSHLDFLRLYRRFGDISPTVEEEEAGAPHVIFVGVIKDTVIVTVAEEFVDKCRLELRLRGINDVHVEVHESAVEHRGGIFVPDIQPRKLDRLSRDGRKVVRSAYRPALLGPGSEIAPLSRQGTRGTAAVFLRLGGHPEKLFVLTNQHVVAENEGDVSQFDDDDIGEPITLMCDDSYSRWRTSLDWALQNAKKALLDTTRELTRIQATVEDGTSMEDAQAAKEAKTAVWLIETDQRRDGLLVKELEELVDHIAGEVDRHEACNRIFGRVRCHPAAVANADWKSAPPLLNSVDGLSYSDDWALIEVGTDILANGDLQNVVELDCDMVEQSRLTVAEGRFVPSDGVLSEDSQMFTVMGLGSVTDLEGRTTPVLKKGAKTGTTFGSASPVLSIVRQRASYNENGTKRPSTIDNLAIPIYDYPESDAPFSATGDSGSAVIDEEGRLIAIMFAGLEKPGANITYATPISFIFDQMRSLLGFDPSLA